jgi:preprotein translocase subunit YajC
LSNQLTLMALIQAAPAAETGGTMQIIIGLLPWLLIFLIFYLLMIRPQQKRVKEHQASLAAIQKGDEIITGGGIRGKVMKVTDDEAEVEIASNVRIRVIKSTISHVLSSKSKPAND